MDIPEAIALEVAEEEFLFTYGEEGELLDSWEENTGDWKFRFFLSSGVVNCNVSANGYDLSCECTDER
ncbi:MAG: hypothetical protein F6K32_10935 [Desertifilum sp. SIO1I2]|nr:hypothetical protein [Desertifilum sp. SIO1I2]